ncbi:hypothetical protein CS8_095780 [Cupriavidus sp. 8B]
MNTVRNVDGVTTANEAEQIQRAGRLVGKGALQHHDRHMLGKLAYALGQHAQRRCVGVQAMIGRIAGDDGDLTSGRDRVLDGKAEAAIGLGQIAGRVMQIRKVSQQQALTRVEHDVILQRNGAPIWRAGKRTWPGWATGEKKWGRSGR